MKQLRPTGYPSSTNTLNVHVLRVKKEIIMYISNHKTYLTFYINLLLSYKLNVILVNCSLVP